MNFLALHLSRSMLAILAAASLLALLGPLTPRSPWLAKTLSKPLFRPSLRDRLDGEDVDVDGTVGSSGVSGKDPAGKTSDDAGREGEGKGKGGFKDEEAGSPGTAGVKGSWGV